MTDCFMCDGDGFDARYVESCPQCGGSGKVTDESEPRPCDVCGREMEAVECCDCAGSGMWEGEPCHNCCGEGVTWNCRGVDRRHRDDN